MKTYSMYNLPRMSKEEAFQELKDNHITFDYSLPQDMLNSLTQFEYSKFIGLTYALILSTTVWVYSKGDYFGKPLSFCNEVQEAWNKYLAR